MLAAEVFVAFLEFWPLFWVDIDIDRHLLQFNAQLRDIKCTGQNKTLLRFSKDRNARFLDKMQQVTATA
jgi:hypothetical protein